MRELKKLMGEGSSTERRNDPEAEEVYCFIHDSRTHSTGECGMLKELRTKGGEKEGNQAKNVTFYESKAGN